MMADLEVLFTSTARVAVLRLFFLNQGNQYYQREIERETGQPIRAIQREVERLEGIGLLTRSAEGNRVFYRLNPEFRLFAELAALVQKAAGLGSAALLAVEDCGAAKQPPREPSTIPQPFEWMETPAIPPLPATLRRVQAAGEWDRAY